ncbi:MAG: VWA domain-containing protein [Pseudobutyrivibrio sp.]|nr:VWA domain-containing protein [Pseudobutyrivibrio sp.]
MKRKSLLNKIISLSIVTVLYLSTTAAAFAEVEVDETPVAEATQEVSENVPEAVEPAAESVAEPTEEPISDSSEESTKEPEAILDSEEVGDGMNESPLAGVTEEVVKILEEITSEEETDEESEDDQEDLEDDETDQDEADEEEHVHDLNYTPNGDGTHKVTCSNCDMEAYTASCVYDDLGYCIKCGYKRLPDPVRIYEDEEVIVTVSGQVPENADLKVTPIKQDVEETKDAFDEVVNKLKAESKDNERDVIGFLAYDICFIDIETGEEKEPTGDVTVSMNYKEAVNPVREELLDVVKQIDVELMHINSETDELENLSEAGGANISKDNSVAVTEATFTNDSFSTYLLKWTGVSNKQITVKFENKEIKGEEIVDLPEIDNTNPATHKPPTIDVTQQSEPVAIADKVDSLEGYRVAKITYGSGNNEKEVTHWKYDYKEHWIGSDDYNLILYHSDKPNTNVATIAFSSNKELPLTVYYERDIDLIVTKVATGEAGTDTTTEYRFTLKDADGNLVSGATYLVGEESLTTSASGEFNLLTGAKAEFYGMTPGKYTITEIGTTGTKYTLSNFTTEVFLGDEKTETYETTSDLPRSTEVTIESNKTKDIKFKNCYTTVLIGDSSVETLDKYVEVLKDESQNVLENKYSISFKFKGPQERIDTLINEIESHEEAENLNVDIIVLIDKSGSMKNTDSGQNKTRIQILKAAVDNMIDVIASKTDVNAKWEIIDFASHAAVKSNGWVTSASAKNYVTTTIQNNENSGVGTGTNYQAAFELAQREFQNKAAESDRPNVKQIVLFLTDGEPTLYYSSGNTLAGAHGIIGNGWNAQSAMGRKFTETIRDKTYASAETLHCDYFYAVGIGLKNINYWDDVNHIDLTTYITADDLLAGIVSHIQAPAENKNSYNISFTNVSTILESLAGKIVSIESGDIVPKSEYRYATDVVMADTLSDNVEIQPNSIFYINVQKNGEDVAQSEDDWINGEIDENREMTKAAEFKLPDGVTLTATYDKATKTVKMIFPEGYVLDDEYEFTVKVYVEASDSAIAAYAADPTYPNTGDEGTDHWRNDPKISSEMDGFFTNGDAYVTYNFKGESERRDFPKPVIPIIVHYEWELIKTDSTGKDGLKLDGAKFSLKDATEGSTLTYSGTSQLAEAGKVVWEIATGDVIETNKNYELTEDTAPFGYVKSNNKWKLNLDADNRPTLAEYDTSDVLVSEYTPDENRNGNVITYTYYIKNNPLDESYALPQTGGMGIYRTTLLGIIMMLASVFLFYRNKRKAKVHR